jgi:hypothetical protein
MQDIAQALAQNFPDAQLALACFPTASLFFHVRSIRATPPA